MLNMSHFPIECINSEAGNRQRSGCRMEGVDVTLMFSLCGLNVNHIIDIYCNCCVKCNVAGDVKSHMTNSLYCNTLVWTFCIEHKS